MSTQDAKEPSEKQRYWLTHLEALEESDQNATTYAAAHGLDRACLYSWRSRLQRMGLLNGSAETSAPSPRRRSAAARPAGDSRGNGGGQGFATVRLIHQNESAPGLRIRFPNGIVLEVGDSLGSAGSEQLLSLLAALR